MTRNEARKRAAQLGLSTWIVEAVAVGSRSGAVSLKCVGFGGIGLALGEGESWEQALAQATRIIFSA